MSSRLLRGYACACVLLVVACSDDPSAPASTPPAPVLESRSSDLRVSDPIAIAFVGDETLPVAFVSVQSGTLQNVSSATLRASGLGAQLPLRHVQVVDGGFDPEGLIAAVGDTVRMAVTSMSGAVTNFFNIVPQERAPSVVRILPHFLQGDVALDTRVRIVFSEPLDEARLNNAAVELRTGNTTVETRLQTDSTRLVIEVTPLRHLEYGTTYGIQISPLITDASGQQLEGQLSSAFTTVHGSESPIKCGVGNAIIDSLSGAWRVDEYEFFTNNNFTGLLEEMISEGLSASLTIACLGATAVLWEWRETYRWWGPDRPTIVSGTATIDGHAMQFNIERFQTEFECDWGDCEGALHGRHHVTLTGNQLVITRPDPVGYYHFTGPTRAWPRITLTKIP